MKISVVIPTYQHAHTISRTLDSLLAQTMRPFEIIIVNDGSTDNLDEALAPFHGLLTRVDQINRGGNAARNRGFDESTGELVLFCDADVVLVPDALETMHNALLDHPEASYAYCAFRFGWKSFHLIPFSPEVLRTLNFVHTTSLLRRQAFPRFDENIRRFQDWDLWLTMLEQGHVGIGIDQELFSVIHDPGRVGISQWAPSVLHKIPWRYLPWRPSVIRRYYEAREIIRQKHDL